LGSAASNRAVRDEQEVQMKPIYFGLTILALQTLAPMAAAEPESTAATPAGLPSCTTRAENFKQNVVTCSLSGTGKTQRFRFQANFSGGHDDTEASMVPRLDGKDLSCDDGSKLYLFGEDGDVSLECRFTLQADSRQHVLEVTISWTHADYTDATLKAM
jgi:hypothetical protein